MKNKNENSDFAPLLKLPKGKVNEIYFEECIKLNKPIASIPYGSIEKISYDKGAPGSTVAHPGLEISSKFNY